MKLLGMFKLAPPARYAFSLSVLLRLSCLFTLYANTTGQVLGKIMEDPNRPSSLPLTSAPSSRYAVNSIDISNQQVNGSETSTSWVTSHLPSRTNAGCCFQSSAIDILGATSFRDDSCVFFVCVFSRSDKETRSTGNSFGFVFISIDSTGHQIFLF